MRAAYQALARRPDIVFSNNSHAGARSYAEWLGLDSARIRVIHNGVDFAHWPKPPADARARFRGAHGVPQEALLVAGVFRLAPEKRPILWVEAAAEALRASELRLRFITDSMRDLISEVDAAGRLRYASPSHRTTLGYDPAALIGQSVFDYIHPDDRRQTQEAFREAAAQLRPVAVACRFRHAAGHYVWIEASGNPVLDEAGRLIGAVLSSRDVTARRLAELAEREQRQLAEALSNTAAALSSSLDLPVVLERVLDNAGQVVPHDAAMILLVEEEMIQVAAQRSVAGLGEAGRLPGLRLPLTEAVSVEAIFRSGQALVLAGRHQCPNPALQAAIGWAQMCVGAPLRHRGQIIGLISLHSAAPDAFSDTHAARLQAFADQAAAAIANARLFESERQRAAELERANALMTALAQVSARIETAAGPDQAMKTLGEALRQLKLQCFIALLRPGDPQLALRYTNLGAGAQALASRALGLKIEGYRFSPEQYPDLHGAVQSRRPRLFTEVQRRLPPAWQHVPKALATFALNQLGLRPGAAFAVIPLIVEEQVQGVLGVWGADLREVDMAPLSVFAGQLATALERVRLLEAEQRRAEELDRSNRLISALADVAARIQGSPALEAVLETLGTRLEPLGVACLVALPSPGDMDLEVRYLSIDPGLRSVAESLAGLRLSQYRVSRRAWIVSECLDQQRPVFSRDLSSVIATMLPGVAGGVASRLASLFGMDANVAMLYLPLKVEDQMLGLLALWGTSLQPGDVPAYSVFASQVAIALRNAQLVAHLEQARQAAEEANRLKSLFLANVSHELRTPLTGILGSLDLVLGQVCETPAEERQFLGLAREAGHRLLKLINDLLDLARIEAGRLQVDVQVLELAPVIAEACGL